MIFDVGFLRGKREHFDKVDEFIIAGGAISRQLKWVFASTVAIRLAGVDSDVINIFGGDAEKFKFVSSQRKGILAMDLARPKKLVFHFCFEGVYAHFEDISIVDEADTGALYSRYTSWAHVKPLFPTRAGEIYSMHRRNLPERNMMLLRNTGYRLVSYFDGEKIHDEAGAGKRSPVIEMKYWSTADRMLAEMG